MRVICGCLGALFISIWSASAQTIEVPLKVQEGSDYYSSAQIKLSTTQPEGSWKLPDLNGRRARFGLVTLGDQKRLVIFARQKIQDTTGSSQVYIDENGDRDLTNEQAIAVGISTSKITINGKALPYSFNIRNYGNESKIPKTGEDLYLLMEAQYHFEGKFTFNGQNFLLSIDDANANGHLGDMIEPGETKPTGHTKLRNAYQGDVLSLNHQDSYGTYYDHFIVGKWIGIKQQVFSIQIDDANQKVFLTPVSDNVASVKLSCETERLWLVSEDGRESISYLSPGNSITVPKGKYRVMDYTISKKDEQGDLWTALGSATANTPAFSAETPNALCQFGEPYTPIVEVLRSNKTPSSQPLTSNSRLQFYIVGTNQEVLRSIRHVSGNLSKIAMTPRDGLPKEPTYTIVKADGEVAAQGNFEYG